MFGVQKKQALSFNKLAGVFAGLLCFIAINALLIAGKHPGTRSGSIASLTELSSPLYFFTDGDGQKGSKYLPSAPVELKTPLIVNHIDKGSAAPAKNENLKTNELPTMIVRSQIPELPLTYVRFTETIAPKIKELKEYQELQVKEALEASKKVLEEKQWKDVEKRIGDAMSSDEKDVLKCQYEKELSKVDWKKMKDKLTMAYDVIDWNRVNENLSSAITEIKIDSLQKVYNSAIVDLTSLQKELTENNLKGIPDSDISLECVEQKKANVQKAINTLIKIKTRKIVHL